MLNMGSFNLAGKQLTGMIYFTVRKVHDVIVLEFYNNAIIPIRVSEDELYICNSFICECAENAVISVNSMIELNAVSVEVELDIDGDKVRVESEAYGDIYVRGWKKVYTASYLNSYLAKHDISRCEGFSWAKSQFTGVFGYHLKERDGFGWIITFPNGMKFPIVGTYERLRVLDVESYYANPISLICVRVYHISPDSVEFRLIFNSGHVVSCFDHIRYTKQFVTYRDRRMKAADLTKLLVLGIPGR